VSRKGGDKQGVKRRGYVAEQEKKKKGDCIFPSWKDLRGKKSSFPFKSVAAEPWALEKTPCWGALTTCRTGV